MPHSPITFQEKRDKAKIERLKEVIFLPLRTLRASLSQRFIAEVDLWTFSVSSVGSVVVNHIDPFKFEKLSQSPQGSQREFIFSLTPSLRLLINISLQFCNWLLVSLVIKLFSSVITYLGPLMNPFKEYNHLGIIPGPGETEEQYSARALYCLTLKETFQTRVGPEFPQENLEPISPKALDQVEHLYAIRPNWIPFFFSNYRLPFWQGGCAWIFQQSEDSPVSAFFQLRQAFRDSPTYLKIYHRDELIAHELSHVGRMAFEEPRYEELLAYRTALSPFRKYWGPLFTTPAQSGIFALLLLLIVMADLLTLLFQPEIYPAVQWIKVFPLLWLGWLTYDLIDRQNRFKKCLKKLPEQILYRLTDREIDRFAGLDSAEIEAYAAQQTCLRWRAIRDHQSKNGGKNSATNSS